MFKCVVVVVVVVVVVAGAVVDSQEVCKHMARHPSGRPWFRSIILCILAPEDSQITLSMSTPVAEDVEIRLAHAFLQERVLTLHLTYHWRKISDVGM